MQSKYFKSVLAFHLSTIAFTVSKSVMTRLNFNPGASTSEAGTSSESSANVLHEGNSLLFSYFSNIILMLKLIIYQNEYYLISSLLVVYCNI